PLYTERELTHQLKDAGIEVCVTLDVLYPKVAEVRDAVGLREVIVGKVTDYVPFPVNLLAPLRMKKEAKHTGEPWPPVPPGANVMQGASWFPDLREGEEGMMCIIPFFHSYGMTVGMNVGIYKAAKLVLMPRFDLEPTLKVIQKEKPTLFPGVPRLYIAINEG